MINSPTISLAQLSFRQQNKSLLSIIIWSQIVVLELLETVEQHSKFVGQHFFCQKYFNCTAKFTLAVHKFVILVHNFIISDCCTRLVEQYFSRYKNLKFCTAKFTLCIHLLDKRKLSKFVGHQFFRYKNFNFAVKFTLATQHFPKPINFLKTSYNYLIIIVSWIKKYFCVYKLF